MAKRNQTMKPEPKPLSPRHREILRILAGGVTVSEVARLTSTSRQTVSRIKSTPAGRAYIDGLMSRMDQVAVSMHFVVPFADTGLLKYLELDEM